ncbi:MAG: hypothetical protein IT314_01705 [Anaerolineales bacterium]|nr:hypothetical protein [Anaerolineales bacterium]
MSSNSENKPNERVRVKLDNRQITVQLKPPKPPKKSIIRITGWPLAILVTILSFVILYFLALMSYVFPKNTRTVQYMSSDVGIAYTSPKYLSVGDDNVIEVSVINLGAKDTLNGVVTLKFHNPIISIIAGSDQGITIAIKDLPPGGRLTKSFEVNLTKRPSEKVIYFYFQYSSLSQSLLQLNRDANRIGSRSQYDKFLISPIDNLRSSWGLLVSLVSGTGLVGIVSNYLWGRFKKIIGWE